jgi:hypothetical protein
MPRPKPNPGEDAAIDSLTFGDVVKRAAQVLHDAGLDRRIDYYRDVVLNDPTTERFLGRKPRVTVRVKITAISQTFERALNESDLS